MPHQPHRLIPKSFTPGPSLALRTRVDITPDFGRGATIAGYAVSSEGPVPAAIGLDRAALTEAGFTGAVGQALVLPQASGPTLVAVGIGEHGRLTTATLRDASAAFARAGRHARHLETDLVSAADALDPAAASAAVVEGALLARYRYLELKTKTTEVPLEVLDLVGSTADAGGVTRDLALARATALARDLAAAPPSHLTATVFGDFAEALAPGFWLELELELSVFDTAELSSTRTSRTCRTSGGPSPARRPPPCSSRTSSATPLGSRRYVRPHAVGLPVSVPACSSNSLSDSVPLPTEGDSGGCSAEV